MIGPFVIDACRPARHSGRLGQHHRAALSLADAYVERVIGSMRREYPDHLIILNEAGLGRVLARYVSYYTRARTHLALEKDTPVPRPVALASIGRIVATPEVAACIIATTGSPRRNQSAAHIDGIAASLPSRR